MRSYGGGEDDGFRSIVIITAYHLVTMDYWNNWPIFFENEVKNAMTIIFERYVAMIRNSFHHNFLINLRLNEDTFFFSKIK